MLVALGVNANLGNILISYLMTITVMCVCVCVCLNYLCTIMYALYTVYENGIKELSFILLQSKTDL